MPSLDRLIAILDAVSGSAHPASAVEVAEATGLSLSTVSRLMIEFADAGPLHRSERDRRYRLGPKIYSLSRAAESGLELESLGRPLLAGLRDAFGETVSMHVLRGRQRVCTLEVPSREPLRRVVPAGTAESVVGSATGAVLLADTPSDELDDPCATGSTTTGPRAASATTSPHRCCCSSSSARSSSTP